MHRSWWVWCLGLAVGLPSQRLVVSDWKVPVGASVTVTALVGSDPAVGVPLDVATENAPPRVLGVTGADGSLRWSPDQPGRHEVSTTVQGVRCVVPVLVADESRNWILVFGSGPLGLALLWLQIRTLRRRRPHSATPSSG